MAQRIEAGDFGLLVLDIFMPGMDGLETMRLIRRQQPMIPILAISGRPLGWDASTGPDFLKMATKLGAISSLQKPFKPVELLAAVSGCLAAATSPPASSVPSGDLAAGQPCQPDAASTIAKGFCAPKADRA
jgi:CheY-like chemotaxis protein